MNSTAGRLLPFGLIGVALLGVPLLSGQPAPPTGPQTEKRFPPLRVPAGFKATLFACDPLIEYPSAIALGPRPGSAFVAADYMTGLGTDGLRRDEVRLVEDTDGDGYADRAPVYAGDFNSIQGLTYDRGTVYVMHAPLLTALRDTDGDGRADERRDLVKGLGLPPEQNPVRLHCANGVVMGYDGWLYLALGDHGCKVERPAGPSLVLQGGGILRCRADGSGLHVFATGLRNIYDVALDDDLNVFVRDNENDGGDYKIRVCHSFFGADHGYPYLYYERPDEALPPLADLGLGSSAGGVCYLEPRFPAEYHGNLFFCEWGRSVVRYRPERAGSSFAPLKEIEFAAGADNDPYGFKPTDLVVDRDGSLLVADWGDGQRPKRGRARIYRIAPTGEAKPPAPLGADAPLAERIARLDAESYHERALAQGSVEGGASTAALQAALREGKLGVRGRMHAVWALARSGATPQALLRIAKADSEPRVQVQAVRAAVDIAEPALGGKRVEAAALAAELAEFADGRDPRVVLEVVVALGRLGWADAPDWLRRTLTKPDRALEHAAMQTLRRSGNWPAVLQLLDLPDGSPLRAAALRAVADRAEAEIVDGLIERLRAERDGARRRAYADALTRVHRKPGPWVYWGYRPPPRPPGAVNWERTEAIEEVLNCLLADAEGGVRLAVLRRMQREKIPVRAATLGRWLRDERQAESVAALLASLRDLPAGEALVPLLAVMRQKEHTTANRLTALNLVVDRIDDKTQGQWLELADVLEDGPVLAALLPRTGKLPPAAVKPLLVRKLASRDAEVRAAALAALTERKADEATEAVPRFLDDEDARVRQAAAVSAGKLGVRPAIDRLLKRARDPDPGVRRASLDALRQLREPRVVPLALAALTDPHTQMPALECVTALGGPEQAEAVAAVARQHPSADMLAAVVSGLTAWADMEGVPAGQRLELHRAVAELQGASGALVRWQVTGPLPAKEAGPLVDQVASAPEAPFALDKPAGWRTAFTTDTDARLNLGKGADGAVWVAVSDVVVSEPTPVQFLGASRGAFRVWLNGRPVHRRDQAGALQPDSERFTAPLDRGVNRVVVQAAAHQGAGEFHLRVRRKSSEAERERLIEAALTRRGNADRGRKVFFDVEKALCSKCHRIGEQGERIGPELTGVGSRFSRVYLTESILEPSRTIAPSYESVLLGLRDGRLLTGLVVEETEKTLTLADNSGQKQVLAKAAIEERHRQAQSTMPDGLEKRLTVDEFVDLIAFLVSQKGASR
jgi:putative membrane-bound dehydrogenase-like protein